MIESEIVGRRQGAEKFVQCLDAVQGSSALSLRAMYLRQASCLFKVDQPKSKLLSRIVRHRLAFICSSSRL